MDSEIDLKKADSRTIAKKILQDEIDGMEEYLKYLENKNKKLKDELNDISKYIDEDKRITNASRKYVKEHDFSSDTKIDEEEIDDNIDEVHSKMELLHSQLCNLTKKFIKSTHPKLVTHDTMNLSGLSKLVSDQHSLSPVNRQLSFSNS